MHKKNHSMKWFALIVIVMILGLAIAPNINALKDDNTIIHFSDGNILYVGGSGPGNYTKIQNAIDEGRPRFQIRIQFGAFTDDDDAADGWGYVQANVDLSVTVSE